MNWTEQEYNTALERVAQLMCGKRGTVEGDELNQLVTLCELYEKRHFPIDPPDTMEVMQAVQEKFQSKFELIRSGQPDCTLRCPECGEVFECDPIYGDNVTSQDAHLYAICPKCGLSDVPEKQK